jgi:hypothetical protein
MSGDRKRCVEKTSKLEKKTFSPVYILKKLTPNGPLMDCCRVISVSPSRNLKKKSLDDLCKMLQANMIYAAGSGCASANLGEEQ